MLDHKALFIDGAREEIFGPVFCLIPYADEAQAIRIANDSPFGGYKQSGNGREWGEEGLNEFVEVKAIQV